MPKLTITHKSTFSLFKLASIIFLYRFSDCPRWPNVVQNGPNPKWPHPTLYKVVLVLEWRLISILLYWMIESIYSIIWIWFHFRFICCHLLTPSNIVLSPTIYTLFINLFSFSIPCTIKKSVAVWHCYTTR